MAKTRRRCAAGFAGFSGAIFECRAPLGPSRFISLIQQPLDFSRFRPKPANSIDEPNGGDTHTPRRNTRQRQQNRARLHMTGLASRNCFLLPISALFQLPN